MKDYDWPAFLWVWGPVVWALSSKRAREMSNDSLLLRAAEASRLCAISKVTWHRWDSAGRIPQGLKIGGAKVWRRAELEAWILAGTPDRVRWQAIQTASKKGGK